MDVQEGLVAPHIAIREGVRGGRPHIDGRGFAVDFVAELHVDCGWTVRRIAQEYDLTPAEIHAALAYYYDHAEEILCRREEDRRFLEEEIRKAPPSRVDKIRDLAR
jgi:uncharacterized protein (DUF433 family)